MPVFDDNLISQIRAQQIFAPEPFVPTGNIEVDEAQSIFPQQPSFRTNYLPGNDVPDDGLQDYDVTARMAELYQPREEMIRRYNEAIGQMPKRENYKPGLGRRIAGSISALSNPERGAAIVSGGFNRELSNWQRMMDPAYKAASLENDYNTNMRAIANAIVSQEMADRRIERQENRDRVLREQGAQRISQGDTRLEQSGERIEQGDTRLQQNTRRIDIAAEVAKGGRFEVDDQGNAFMVYRDGSTAPVDASYLTAEQKAALQAKSRAGSRDRVRSEVIDDPDNPGKKIAVVINLDTGVVRRAKIESEEQPGVRTTVTPTARASELESQRAWVTNARKAMSNPRWAKFIKIKGTDISITRPNALTTPLGFAPTAEEYTAMSKAIYGTDVPPQGTNVNPGGVNTPTNPGKVKVRRLSDGATGQMDANDPALRSGRYEVVQ